VGAAKGEVRRMGKEGRKAKWGKGGIAEESEGRMGRPVSQG
jgi:hypothetical protein